MFIIDFFPHSTPPLTLNLVKIKIKTHIIIIMQQHPLKIINSVYKIHSTILKSLLTVVTFCSALYELL